MATAILKNGHGPRSATTAIAARLSAQQTQQIASYIKARRVAAEAAAILEKMKASTLAIVRMAGGRIEADEAIVLLGHSVSYDYPPAIRNQEDKLRNLKKIMQLDGRAAKIEKECLQFSDQKNV